MSKDDLILQFDAFEGDFGEIGDKVFSNRMVAGRKKHECSHCCGEIAMGERHRCQVSKFDGELMTHRWCGECCKLMAACATNLEDSDGIFPSERYEQRSALHSAAAKGDV